MSGPTIDRREAAGDFPKRLQLSARAVGWLEGEVDDWLARRAAQRKSSEPLSRESPNSDSNVV